MNEQEISIPPRFTSIGSRTDGDRAADLFWAPRSVGFGDRSFTGRSSGSHTRGDSVSKKKQYTGYRIKALAFSAACFLGGTGFALYSATVAR